MVKDKGIYLQRCLRLYLFSHRVRKRLVKLCNHAHRSKTESRVQNMHTEAPTVKKKEHAEPVARLSYVANWGVTAPLVITLWSLLSCHPRFHAP